MEKLPDLTSPSSRVQPSERLYWKKRSASSARWARMVPKTRSVATWSTPKGVSRVALAMSRVDGSGLVTGRLSSEILRKVRSSAANPGSGSPLTNGLVGQCRKAATNLSLICGVHARHDNPRAARQPVEHDAPGIHDHRMTVRLATVHVVAALGGGDHVGQVLDGAGANQSVPMRLAGGLGESGRDEDQVYVAHGAVELGEARS